ncbi:MAG: alpha/beta fold hydrolase [Gammaproteobacteria bacterium]|nr:alpha/beta fold hydrolase [Gammaproteobacteria bacterium]MYE51709.1 alpha/beta fold hydrolase [Gammaproteobacteria bacterium]
MARTEQHGPPRGKTVESAGLTLHYHDDGAIDGNGRTVVFVHGSGPGASGYSNFKLNAPVLAGAGYRVLVPDLPGFGYSSKPADIDYTTDFFVTHLIGLLDAIGIHQCALVGNSLGGAVCIRAALDHPERVEKLVLMAPGGIEELDTYMAMPAMARMIANFTSGALDRGGLRQILQTLVFDPAVVTDALVNERYAIAQTQPPEVLGRMRIPNMEGELGNITCPVLAFWGMDDEMLPPGGGHKIIRACRPSRLIEVADCGHWVMVEHARMFNAACLDFLDND